MKCHPAAAHRSSPVRTLVALLIIAALGLLAGCGEQTLTRTSGQDAAGQSDGGGGGLDAGTDASGGDDTGPSNDAGGDDTGPSDDAGPVDPCLDTTPQQASDFADSFTTGLCERLLSCESNPQVAEIVNFAGWSSVQNCVRLLHAGVISPGRAREAAEEGSLTLNSCKASECLQDLPTLSCDGAHRTLTEARYGAVSSCYEAFAGTRPTGSSCSVDGQCEGEAVCSRETNSASCTGTCTDAGQAGSGQCGDIVCAADQYCQTDNNICITRKGPGEPCENEYECAIDAYCDLVGGSCKAISTGLGTGESCNLQTKLCSFDYACIGDTCSEFLGEGESCQFIGCDGNFFCGASGQCEPRKTAGASCGGDQECASLICAGGTCADAGTLCPGD